MATSGTTAFDLDFTDIAEEAWERAGGELRTGYDLATTRRSMNLLLIEWQSRGINLWTVDDGEIPLLANTSRYELPSDTIDVMEMVIRTGSGANQSDLAISRISVSTYANISNKLITGRPIQAWIERLRDNPWVNVWPVPDRSSYYTFKYWRLRRMEDAGNGAETADVNYRFLPALVAGLAYYIAMKRPDFAPRMPLLKEVYDEQFGFATNEDRERATWSLTPRIARV